MAFTPEQEASLLQVIEAFTNGKRLNELPFVGKDSNPFNLISEVLDEDGENKQAKLAELLPYIEEQCAYGIEFDTTISSPTCTRVGNLSLHKLLPIQSRMKGCLLDNNGKVVEYLNASNWRAHDLTGAKGQVMVEIPKHYRRFDSDGTIRRVMVSEYPLPGYHIVNVSYVSAYEATIQRSTSMLSSVVNMDADYRGCENQSDWDGTYRSALGRPATAISRTSFRNYARKRKAASSEWNCNVYEQYKTIYWLFTVEYANLNCQSAFNAQPTSEGFKQGGLGDGVTTLGSAEWSTFNGYYPFVPCGHTDELGNNSGEVAYEIINESGAIQRTVMVPRYRGIENAFGHIWKWTDGINIEIKNDADGGTSKVYVCTDPAKFIDSGYSGYEFRGLEARTDGYVKELIFGEFGDIMPLLVGGGSTTYHCDYHYTSVSSTSLRGVLFGGAANDGSGAGFACAYSVDAPSLATALLGSRLCFLPA